MRRLPKSVSDHLKIFVRMWSGKQHAAFDRFHDYGDLAGPRRQRIVNCETFGRDAPAGINADNDGFTAPNFCQRGRDVPLRVGTVLVGKQLDISHRAVKRKLVIFVSVSREIKLLGLMMRLTLKLGDVK